MQRVQQNQHSQPRCTSSFRALEAMILVLRVSSRTLCGMKSPLITLFKCTTLLSKCWISTWRLFTQLNTYKKQFIPLFLKEKQCQQTASISCCNPTGKNLFIIHSSLTLEKLLVQFSKRRLRKQLQRKNTQPISNQEYWPSTLWRQIIISVKPMLTKVVVRITRQRVCEHHLVYKNTFTVTHRNKIQLTFERV